MNVKSVENLYPFNFTFTKASDRDLGFEGLIGRPFSNRSGIKKVGMKKFDMPWN